MIVMSLFCEELQQLKRSIKEYTSFKERQRLFRVKRQRLTSRGGWQFLSHTRDSHCPTDSSGLKTRAKTVANLLLRMSKRLCVCVHMYMYMYMCHRVRRSSEIILKVFVRKHVSFSLSVTPIWDGVMCEFSFYLRTASGLGRPEPPIPTA